MPDFSSEPESLDVDSLLVIVVGAHLRAEVSDRPIGYRLRERVLQLLDQQAAHALTPVVCTDLWYLNARELMERPTVSIGDPGVNAATAYFSTRLPTAFVIENTLRVHLDPDFLDLRACLWGANHSTTVSAADLFIERYLPQFIEAAMSSNP